MAEFTEESIGDLGIFLPTYANNVCKQAIDLSLSLIQGLSLEQVIRYMSLHHQIELSVDSSKTEAMAGRFQPLAKVDELPGGAETFKKDVKSLMPDDILKELAPIQKLDLSGRKAFAATGLLYLVKALFEKESALRANKVRESEQIMALDPISNDLCRGLETLRNADQNLSYMQTRRGRQTGNANRNKKFRVLGSQTVKSAAHVAVSI